MNKILLAILVLFLASSLASPASKVTVKIAVASDGTNVTSSVSDKAGRCGYYLILDSRGKLTEVVTNPHMGERHRAGSQTAEFLSRRNVTTVIAGNFGDKMIQAMEQSGLGHVQLRGTVEDAVRELLNPGSRLLVEADRNLNPESFESYRKLVNIEPDGRQKEFVLFTVKKGKNKVAATFLSPASEKGRSTLRLDDNMWLYVPNVGRPKRITNLQSVIEGVFNNADIFRLDYSKEYSVETVEERKEGTVLTLRANTKTVAYDRLKMTVDRALMLPTQIDCYASTGMLVKTLHFKKVKDFGGGIVRPSVVESHSPLQKGYKSVMIFTGIKLRELSDEVFTPSYMSRIKDLP